MVISIRNALKLLWNKCLIVDYKTFSFGVKKAALKLIIYPIKLFLLYRE